MIAQIIQSWAEDFREWWAYRKLVYWRQISDTRWERQHARFEYWYPSLPPHAPRPIQTNFAFYVMPRQASLVCFGVTVIEPDGYWGKLSGVAMNAIWLPKSEWMHVSTSRTSPLSRRSE